MAKSGSNEYDAYERLAVTGGIIPDNNQVISKGRWTYVKEKDYYIRYLPQGYRKILVQLYVLERKSPIQTGHGPYMQDLFDFSEQPLCFDPSGNLANPPGMDMQRLICGFCTDNSFDNANALEKLLSKLWIKIKALIGGDKYTLSGVVVAGVRG